MLCMSDDLHRRRVIRSRKLSNLREEHGVSDGDPRVREAQELVNRHATSVAGISPVPVDGKTSWTVMYGLRRCLQYWLGLSDSERSNSFTPLTLSTLQAKYPQYDSSSATQDITQVIQAALYCKGYEAGGIDGVYGPLLEAAFTKFKTNIGLGANTPPGASG